MADLPIDLDAGLSAQLARVLDVEGKIARTLEALGPVGGRDVVVIDGSGGLRARRLTELGAQVVSVDSTGPATFGAPDDSADVMVAFWSAFREPDAASMAEAGRILRRGGRLLVVHDYGRDDVARLRGALPEHGPWSRRDGPFLSAGGSSLLANWTLVAILLRISDHARRPVPDAQEASAVGEAHTQVVKLS